MLKDKAIDVKNQNSKIEKIFSGKKSTKQYDLKKIKIRKENATNVFMIFSVPNVMLCKEFFDTNNSIAAYLCCT
ncbi:hypothetical protein SDC9_150042 [bioreactor metagenome]|uniref:Uncharacterized protein n=1 Tax=bioreactor metagenome TaxID=1076179 RepID=A0A645EQE1_9ZZZZ|nr:hypothetical protein [Proteiniphilum sp.]